MGFRSAPSGLPYDSFAFDIMDWRFYVAKIARAWIADPAKKGWLDTQRPNGAERWNLHTMTALAMTAFDDLAMSKAAQIAERQDSYSMRLLSQIHAQCAKAILSITVQEWINMAEQMLDNYDEFVDVGRSPWFVNSVFVDHPPNTWMPWAMDLLRQLEAENARK